MNTKIIIGIIAAVVVIGGTTGTILGVNAYQEKKAQEEQQRIEQEQLQQINTYNDRITGVVNALNVPDAEGQNPSLDNNSDVDAMNNAIASLQAIEAEINNDTTMTEEQKNALRNTIAGSISSITNRVNIVNEERARAEAEAQAEAERQAQAEAERKATKKAKSTTSSSNNESSNENSSNSNSNNYDEDEAVRRSRETIKQMTDLAVKTFGSEEEAKKHIMVTLPDGTTTRAFPD